MADVVADKEEAIEEVAGELFELMENGEHAEMRYGAALQLIGMGRAKETIGALGKLVDAPVGEHRTRAAAQLGRLGAVGIGAYPSLVRAVVNRDDDGLALAAVEALNAIDPENLIGAPQVVRLLRRRVLKMWRGGAFLRVQADESLMIRLVRALAINGRLSEDACFELQHLAITTTGRVRETVREVLKIIEVEETEPDPES